MRYDPEDMSLVYIYDTKTNGLISEVPRQRLVGPVATKKELGEISKNYHQVQNRIKANLKHLWTEFDSGREELDAMPVVALNNPSKIDQHLAEKEEKHLLKKASKTLVNTPNTNY